MLWAYGGCATITNYKKKNINYDNYCYEFTENKVNRLVSNEFLGVPVIIVHNNTMHFSENNIIEYEKNYMNTICAIAKKHETYLVKPIPVMDVDVPNQLIKNTLFNNNNNDVFISLESYYKKNNFVINIMEKTRMMCNVKLLDPVARLCPDGNKCLGSKNGIPLYNDYIHLNEYGNSFLIPMFEEAFIKN